MFTIIACYLSFAERDVRRAEEMRIRGEEQETKSRGEEQERKSRGEERKSQGKG